MKKVLIIILSAICILGLAACSNSDEESGGALLGFMSNDSSAPGSAPSGGMINSDSARYESAELSVEQARKLIRNANMTIEAEDAAELFKNLTEFNNAMGGYEFSSSTFHHDTYSTVEAVLKVPPHRLDEFMNFAGENGRIVRSSTTSDDVTEQYFDMQTRVESRRRSLESYYVLLENADNLNDILNLQRTIDGIIEDIEAFEGRLRVLDNLVEMATVSLYISQRNDPVLEERREIDWSALSLDDMGYFIRTGFISVINVIAAVVQWILIAVLVTSPIWLIVLIVSVIVIHRRRKRVQIPAQNEPAVNKAENGSAE